MCACGTSNNFVAVPRHFSAKTRFLLIIAIGLLLTEGWSDVESISAETIGVGDHRPDIQRVSAVGELSMSDPTSLSISLLSAVL
jgi:hypothetical protein